MLLEEMQDRELQKRLARRTNPKDLTWAEMAFAEEHSPGLPGERKAAQAASFSDERAERLRLIMGYVREHGPCTAADIAEGTGVATPTARDYVNRQAYLGKIRKTKNVRTFMYEMPSV